MKVDENTLLSGYLDGELEPAARSLLDGALAADTGLAEELRALAAVRDLVSGLGRDASVDVSSRVIERIVDRKTAGRRQPLSAPRPWGRRRVAALAGWLTTAAAVMAASTLAIVQGVRAPGLADSGADAQGLATAASDRSPAGALPEVAVASRGSMSGTGRASSSGSHSRTPATPGATPDSGTLVASTGVRQPDSELQGVRQLLDNPSLRRCFFVKNSRGGNAEQRVASVVEKTVRHGYFTLTISQGIVIDPRHPDEATVFALVVGPDELENLREQLKVALADGVEEGPADPRVVTQLADIGPAELNRPGAPAAVSIPREGFALKTRDAGPDESDPVVGSQAASPPRTPTPEQFRSAPVPPPGSPGAAVDPHAGNERDAPRPGECVVIVWVYRPPPEVRRIP